MLAYRADIDGLRAIAIISVVLFHADESLLPGGFTGVDIFFVISGYLITSIIHAELQAGAFSFRTFFIRRARRILPALCAMLAVVTVFAALVLLPRDLEEYGKVLSHTVLFAANFWFAQEKGYFDPEFQDNPLLHVWSLAVEEQFYFVWPLLLFALFTAFRQHVLKAAALILVLSLFYSAWAAGADPRNAFFHLPSRAFELLLGALLAISASRIQSRALAALSAFAGLALMAAGMMLLDEASQFPGFNALLPCLGAALLILSGSQTTVAHRCLSHPVFTFTGKISYSWYLWHWPPLAFARYYLDRPLDLVETLFCVVLGLALAVLSWRFVERPFRNPETYRRLTRPALRGALAAGVTFVAAGSLFQETDGLPIRLNAQAAAVYYEAAKSTGATANIAKYSCRESHEVHGYSDHCVFGSETQNNTQVLLWGDSHARHFLPAIAKITDRKNIRGEAVISSACPPVSNASIYFRYRSDRTQLCLNSNNHTLNYIKNNDHIKIVVLGGRWSFYVSNPELERSIHSNYFYEQDDLPPSSDKAAIIFRDKFSAMIEDLVNSGKIVLILRQVPPLSKTLPVCLAKHYQFGISKNECNSRNHEEIKNVLAPVTATFDSVQSSHASVITFNPEKHLCSNGVCSAVVNGDSMLYRDDNHLNLQGAQFLHPHIERIFPSIQALTKNAQNAGAR